MYAPYLSGEKLVKAQMSRNQNTTTVFPVIVGKTADQ